MPRATKSIIWLAALSLLGCQPCGSNASAPLTLSAEGAVLAVNLHWQPSPISSNDQVYVVERRQAQGDYVLIAETSALAVSDTAVVAGEVYEYRLRLKGNSCHRQVSPGVTAIASASLLEAAGVACTTSTLRWQRSNGAQLTDIRWSNTDAQLAGNDNTGNWDFFDAQAATAQYSIFAAESEFVGWDVGDQLVGFSALNSISLYTAANGESNSAIADDFGFVSAAVWQQQPARVFVAGGDRLFAKDLHGALTNSQLAAAHAAKITVLAISADEKLVASGDQDGTVAIWDTQTLTPVTAMTSFLGSVKRLRWLSETENLAATYEDGITRIYAPPSWSILRAIERGQINYDGSAFAAYKGQGDVGLFATKTGQEICHFTSGATGVNDLIWAMHADAIAVVGDRLEIWDVGLLRPE